MHQDHRITTGEDCIRIRQISPLQDIHNQMNLWDLFDRFGQIVVFQNFIPKNYWNECLGAQSMATRTIGSAPYFDSSHCLHARCLMCQNGRSPLTIWIPKILLLVQVLARRLVYLAIYDKNNTIGNLACWICRIPSNFFIIELMTRSVIYFQSETAYCVTCWHEVGSCNLKTNTGLTFEIIQNRPLFIYTCIYLKWTGTPQKDRSCFNGDTILVVDPQRCRSGA